MERSTPALPGHYKVPRSVQLVAVLPFNAAGKVLKGELRSQ